jgi:hypothetical protein
MATIRELRALNEASPFRPFRVRTPDGRTFTITHDAAIARGNPDDDDQLMLATIGGWIPLDLRTVTLEPLDDLELAEQRQRPRLVRSEPGIQPYHLYELLHAQPFWPFTIYLFSQHHYEIKDPKDAGLRDGVLVVRSSGRECWISPEAIANIEIEPGPSAAGRVGALPDRSALCNRLRTESATAPSSGR